MDDIGRREEEESMTSIDFSTQPERSLSPGSRAGVISPPPTAHAPLSRPPAAAGATSPTLSFDLGDMSTSVDAPIDMDHPHLRSYFSPSPIPDDDEEEEEEEEEVLFTLFLYEKLVCKKLDPPRPKH